MLLRSAGLISLNSDHSVTTVATSAFSHASLADVAYVATAGSHPRRKTLSRFVIRRDVATRDAHELPDLHRRALLARLAKKSFVVRRRCCRRPDRRCCAHGPSSTPCPARRLRLNSTGHWVIPRGHVVTVNIRLVHEKRRSTPTPASSIPTGCSMRLREFIPGFRLVMNATVSGRRVRRHGNDGGASHHLG